MDFQYVGFSAIRLKVMQISWQTHGRKYLRMIEWNSLSSRQHLCIYGNTRYYSDCNTFKLSSMMQIVSPSDFY